MIRDPLWFRSVRMLSAVILLIWLVLPLFPLLIWSFAHGWRFPDLLPSAWSPNAWAYAFSKTSGVGSGIWLSLQIAVLTTVVALVLGIPAGRALGIHMFRGKRLVELLILAPIIVPGIAVALGLHGIFIRLGVTQTVTGVVIVHLVPTLPYVILVMAGIFSTFDTDFEHQARSLGASPFQTFRRVTLPAIMPGIMVAALFAFLISWSQYILTLVIGGGRVVTLPLVLFNFANAGRHDITGAISMIYILPGLLVLIVTARRLTGHNAALVRVKP